MKYVITHVTNTKIGSLKGVYFEDSNEEVYGALEAWECVNFLYRYFKTKESLETFLGYKVY